MSVSLVIWNLVHFSTLLPNTKRKIHPVPRMDATKKMLKNENLAKSDFRNCPNYSKMKHPEIMEVNFFKNLSKINKIAKVNMFDRYDTDMV